MSQATQPDGDGPWLDGQFACPLNGCDYTHDREQAVRSHITQKADATHEGRNGSSAEITIPYIGDGEDPREATESISERDGDSTTQLVAGDYTDLQRTIIEMALSTQSTSAKTVRNALVEREFGGDEDAAPSYNYIWRTLDKADLSVPTDDDPDPPAPATDTDPDQLTEAQRRILGAYAVLISDGYSGERAATWDSVTELLAEVWDGHTGRYVRQVLNRFSDQQIVEMARGGSLEDEIHAVASHLGLLDDADEGDTPSDDDKSHSEPSADAETGPSPDDHRRTVGDETEVGAVSAHDAAETVQDDADAGLTTEELVFLIRTTARSRGDEDEMVDPIIKKLARQI